MSRETRQAQRKLGSTNADGKWQLGSPTAADDEKTQNVTGYKRRARLPLMHRTMPAIYRRRFSTTPTRRKRNQLKQPVDQDEQPVPKVEEEEAAAAKPRSGAGTASSSASKLRRKGEDKCPGTIETRSFAVQRGI